MYVNMCLLCMRSIQEYPTLSVEITNNTKEEKDHIDNAIVKYNAQQVPFAQKIAFDVKMFVPSLV